MRPVDPRLMKYARSARFHIAISAVLGVITAALVIIQAILISAALSPIVTGTGDLADVLPFIGGLALVIIARAGTTAWREARSHRAADHTVRELRRAVLDHATTLGPRWLARHATDTATLLTRGLDDLGPWFTRFLPQLILVCTVTPLALGAMLLLDLWSAIIAALALPLIPLFMVLVGRYTQDSSRARLTVMERLGSQLLDLIAGLPTLRGLGREDSPKKHLEHLGKENTAVTMATLRTAFLSGAVLEFLATLSVALVAVEVGVRLVAGNISLFAGLAVIMLAPEVFEPLRQVGAHYHASANGVAAANAAFEILETSPSDEGGAQSDSASGTQDPALAPDLRNATITLNNLSVAARGRWAPADLTATITPGTITALIGPSGSGKTTTALTLLGLYPPTQGSITVTEAGSSPTNLAAIDRDFWWSQVEWVPQSPPLLPGTLRENLPQGASEDDLARAASATGFDQVIADLPAGWETRIGHGGVGLSVGQRQRLALMHALLSPAPLIILDEPTAHLDAVSEDTVVATLQTLRAAGHTILVIAHRAAVAAAADHTITVPTRAASDEELATWPQLSATQEAEEITAEVPNLLDLLPDLDEGATK